VHVDKTETVKTAEGPNHKREGTGKIRKRDSLIMLIMTIVTIPTVTNTLMSNSDNNGDVYKHQFVTFVFVLLALVIMWY
jgi:hypothetical protein